MSNLPFQTDIKKEPTDLASAEVTRLERLALSLSGGGPLTDLFCDPELEPAASWTPAGGQVHHGRTEIERGLKSLTPPQHFRILQTEIHGRAASISGEIADASHGKRVFCHVIRFTGADRRRIAQLVSFEHSEAHLKTPQKPASPR